MPTPPPEPGVSPRLMLPEHWARQPRWPAARTLALPGRVRGLLCADWAAHLRRRWGAAAVARVRDAVGPAARDLADAPGRDEWLPAGLHLALTDAIIDQMLGGDTTAFEPLLFEDATRNLTRLHRILARAMGPAAALRRIDAVHTRLFDVGAVHAQVHGHAAVLAWRGAELFTNPTWRMLVVFAHRGAMRILTGHGHDEVLAAETGDGFEVRVRWG